MFPDQPKNEKAHCSPENRLPACAASPSSRRGPEDRSLQRAPLHTADPLPTLSSSERDRARCCEEPEGGSPGVAAMTWTSQGNGRSAMQKSSDQNRHCLCSASRRLRALNANAIVIKASGGSAHVTRHLGALLQGMPLLGAEHDLRRKVIVRQDVCPPATTKLARSTEQNRTAGEEDSRRFLASPVSWRICSPELARSTIYT